jgi:hypothetical protein
VKPLPGYLLRLQNTAPIVGEPWGSDGGVTHKNRQQEATSGNAKYRQSIDLYIVLFCGVL